MDIKRKIKEHGMTLAEVANKIDIKAPTLTRIINSKNPKFGSLQKIADVLGITVSELIADSDENRNVTVKCPHCGELITLQITPMNGHDQDKAAEEGCQVPK